MSASWVGGRPPSSRHAVSRRDCGKAGRRGRPFANHAQERFRSRCRRPDRPSGLPPPRRAARRADPPRRALSPEAAFAGRCGGSKSPHPARPLRAPPELRRVSAPSGARHVSLLDVSASSRVRHVSLLEGAPRLPGATRVAQEDAEILDLREERPRRAKTIPSRVRAIVLARHCNDDRICGSTTWKENSPPRSGAPRARARRRRARDRWEAAGAGGAWRSPCCGGDTGRFGKGETALVRGGDEFLGGGAAAAGRDTCRFQLAGPKVETVASRDEPLHSGPGGGKGKEAPLFFIG